MCSQSEWQISESSSTNDPTTTNVICLQLIANDTFCAIMCHSIRSNWRFGSEWAIQRKKKREMFTNVSEIRTIRATKMLTKTTTTKKHHHRQHHYKRLFLYRKFCTKPNCVNPLGGLHLHTHIHNHIHRAQFNSFHVPVADGDSIDFDCEPQIGRHTLKSLDIFLNLHWRKK